MAESISPDELMTPEQIADVRLAMHLFKLSQERFCKQRGFNTPSFNRMLKRKQVPSPVYAEAMNGLLEEAAPHLLRKAKRFADRAGRAPTPTASPSSKSAVEASPTRSLAA